MSDSKTIIYGQDHSPWVQAVLLGAHEKELPYEWKTTPSLSYFLEEGVMMPAAKFPGQSWMKESSRILQNMGFDEVSTDELKRISGAWRGVLHRTDDVLLFLSRFSRASDRHPSLFVRSIRNFLRSYSSFYFLTLIKFLAPKMAEPDTYGDQFLYWVERLEKSEGSFLNGTTPGSLDLLLFGIIQCHCSIPVPPTEAIQNDPRLDLLRSWISAMQERFCTYPHMYSNAYFEPHESNARSASLWDQTCFWLGIIDLTILFPITVPLTIFLIKRTRRA